MHPEAELDLAGFQSRLSEQYTRLRDLRATENYPVYAIEHGLTSAECSEAQALLNASLKSIMRLDQGHWLVWIALAAEVGYRYDGTEYWDSFALSFPLWPRFGSRNQIRSWYKKFAEKFRGLTPSGIWAGQFPIIAWPITQAILPKYLQRHFAEHLFELRHVLVRSGELTLDEIGDLLSERYYGGSSRFEGFLQQKALTARIVLALGQEGIEDSVPPIEKTTLDRIVGDIDNLGSFGTRLREARRVLRNARFINSAKPGFTPTAKQAIATDPQLADRIEKPRLIARPVGEDTWALFLAIPDLATALRQAGLSPRDLDRAQMRFRSYAEGSSWAPARGLFFYNGENEEPITAYPSTDVAVFSFERLLPAVEPLVNERLALPARVLRLLKIHADGSAFELSGRQIRAGQSYIIVTTLPIESSLESTLALRPIQSTATSAHLWQFDAPKVLDATRLAALTQLGLGHQLAVRVEPLGLSPRWAPAGNALVVLATETAMFRIETDVAVREYVVAVDAQPPIRFTPSPSGVTLVSLGSLEDGPHRVIFSALGTATGVNLDAEAILLDVRSPTPWQKAIEGKAGVALRLDPREASLEQFIDGHAHLRAAAPPRRAVTLKCRFFGVDGMLFHERDAGRFNTPLSDDKLSLHFARVLESDASLEHVERAARIEISISLDECGSSHVVFEKEAEPLRWIRVDDKKVRLSDDSAYDTPPSIERFDLDAIDVAKAADYQQALVGLELQSKGGLFAATANGRRYETVVTVIQRQLSGFQELGIPAGVSTGAHNPAALLGALKRWRAVKRLIGPMAYIARRNAISVLERTLAVDLCGADWVTASDRVLNGQQKLGDLYARVYFSKGFASSITSFPWRYEADRAAALTELSRLLDVYKIQCDRALVEPALKLAFQPHNLSAAEIQSATLFDALRSAEALLRGAYFARLVSDVGIRNASSEVA